MDLNLAGVVVDLLLAVVAGGEAARVLRVPLLPSAVAAVCVAGVSPPLVLLESGAVPTARGLTAACLSLPASCGRSRSSFSRMRLNMAPLWLRGLLSACVYVCVCMYECMFLRTCGCECCECCLYDVWMKV